MLKNQLLAVYPLALLVGLGFSQVIKANSDIGSNSLSSQTQFQIHPQTDCRHGCFSAADVNASPVQPSSPPPPPPSNNENDNDNFDNEQDFYQDQNPDLNDNGDYYNNDVYPDNNDHDNDNGDNGGNENPNPG